MHANSLSCPVHRCWRRAWHNGWDTALRLAITHHFGFDRLETEARHRLVFDSYERGYLTFDEYLSRVFCGKIEQVRQFAFDASVPWPENIALLREIKTRCRLKLAVISNEGEGLTEHRVRKFRLDELADFLVFSHFVHMRKPDPQIWRLASHLAQVDASETVYLDDRKLFVEIAADLGFTALHHTSLAATRAAFERLGL